MRCTCLHCFALRMRGAEVERFRRRLELLSQGRLVEAQGLVVGTSASAQKQGGDIVDDAMETEDLAGGGDPLQDYDVAAAIKSSARRAASGAPPAGRLGSAWGRTGGAAS